MKLSHNTETKTVQSPRLYQQMKVLEMSGQELEEYINELSMENPLIELPAYGSSLSSGRAGKSREDRYGELPYADECPCTLKTELEGQLVSMKLDGAEEQALRFLIINLDHRGYLPEWISGTVAWKGNKALFDRALGLLQAMEPAGVGARSAAECLQIQLERRGAAASVAWTICGGYLEHLARNHINFIARELDVPESEVAEAKTLIASLNPIPSNGYDGGAGNYAVIPDVELELSGGSPKVRLNSQADFNFEISGFYRSMLNSDSISSQERSYFEAKLSQAQWVAEAIGQRKETLLKCVDFLLTEQKDFFESGKGLKPCKMSRAADRIGVHPSTISRTVKNKYLACKWGTFPFSKFFAHDVNGDSVEDLMEELRRIIENEDPKKPLSDSKISQELLGRGYNVARRTVAKYREQANIPPATGRKNR